MAMEIAITRRPRPLELSRLHRSKTKFVSLTQLRKLRECEQVAAVCYRMRGGVIEFLLVRTRGDRWIFPKGNVEPGLTHAQAAALEAFEEAGVHGRIEEGCFIRYARRKGEARSSDSGEHQVAVNAHLCEVRRLERPQETGRNPTWFQAEKAKRRLRQDRSSNYGDELAMVIDRAVTRLHQTRSRPLDSIQKIQFINAKTSMKRANT